MIYPGHKKTKWDKKGKTATNHGFPVVLRSEKLNAAKTDDLRRVRCPRAARFYFLQKKAFGAKVTGQSFGTSAMAPPRLNLLRMEEDLSQAHMRLAKVTIEQLSWAECVARYDRPETLFFFDPPYWQTQGYGNVFGREEYDRLAASMRTMQGRAILTINDHPAMRQAFAGFSRKRIAISYTVGGSGRASEASEMICRTW